MTTSCSTGPACCRTPDLAAEIGARFDHVLVDEYQDTNRLQAAILLALKPDGSGLTVVGDDAQSIYAFRAAEVRNILDFPGLFTPRASVVALEQNYRSTPEILGAANAVIAEAGEGFAKHLRSDRPAGPRPGLVAVRDEAGQVDYVCRTILDAREAGTALKQQAVLFRVRASFRPARSRAGPPQHPVREVRRPQVPRHRARQGRAGLPPPGAEPVRSRRRLPGAAAHPRHRPLDRRGDPRGPGRRARAGDGAAGRHRSRSGLPGIGRTSPRSTPRSGPARPAGHRRSRRCGPGTSRTWSAGTTTPRCAAPTSLQLEAIAAGFPGRERFLTDITLDPPDATSDQAGVPHRDEDYLILSTIHSAKGQEWKQVFVLNCVDGCIPSDLGTGTSAEIDEERRLLYVAMTRARDALHLMLPQRFYTHGQHRHGDRHVYATRTRFIPDRILDRFERAIWPAVAPGAPGGADRRQPVNLDLGARMRSMWE